MNNDIENISNSRSALRVFGGHIPTCMLPSIIIIIIIISCCLVEESKPL